MRLLVLWLLFWFTAVAAGAAPGRNVLLIIADDQGLDLGCYGNPRLKSPHLDALAARGTRFTQAYATVSSCSPSRSVILSGLYSHQNGIYGLAHDVHNQHFLDSVETVPVRLKKAGYTTALVGKKHLKPDSALAFDQELEPEAPGNRDVAALARAAGNFMRAAGNKPFFVTVGYSDPHRAPQNFGNTQAWPQVERQTYAPGEVSVPSHLPDLPEVRQDLAHYYEASSRLDSGVGLLLQELKASGHEQDTLIVYLSDNGRPFPGAKTNLYDEGLHLPLMVYRPGQMATVSHAMVDWADVAPTVLDWAGASPAGLPGKSLLGILEQVDPAGWDEVFGSHSFHEINQYYPMRSIRTRRYHYIVNLAAALPFPVAGDVAESPSWIAIRRSSSALGKRSLRDYLQRPHEELYDVQRDPDEVRNLAADRGHRAVLDEMRRRLEEFRKLTRDPWLPGQTSPHGHH